MARDYQREFKNHCLTCTEYDIYSKSDSTTRGYRCKHHHRPMAFDEKCSSYRFDALKSNMSIEEAVNFRVKKGYAGGPDKGHFYILTILCEIMGLPEDNEYLLAFRTLRDVYLSQNEEGQRELLKYDVCGPLISDAIKDAHDDSKRKVGIERMINEVLMPCYIEPFTAMVQNGCYECAMLAYLQMTDMLAQRYNVFVSEEDLQFSEESLEAVSMGPGRYRVAPKSV